MANEKRDRLTLNIDGISVSGQIVTDLDTGIGKWYPISGPTGPLPILGDKYLTSTKKADGSWSGWTSVNDVFGEIRNQNSQIATAYGTTDKLSTAFYAAGNGTGSPTGILNSGRLNQFNVYGAPQTAKNLKIPGAVNIEEDGGNGGGSGADNESPTDLTTIVLPNQINTAKSAKNKFDTLRYPEKIENNGQDYIKFEVFEYIAQKLSDNNLLFEQIGEYKEVIGTIVLPIQPTIMDTNTVTWNDSRMGILEMMGANISLSGMNSAGGDYMTNMAQKFGETIKGAEGEKVSQEVITAVQNYIAKMAVNSNTNLLSRTGGAITNPNLTLLFESPDLRNFTFNFKLTPRTDREGTIVRKIIRKFKEHMAAQRSVGNLFLETPDVFNISYIRGVDKKNEVENKKHKSLNLFKTCALRSFSVNYTPSGTYMTYNDEAGTMTSYDLTMAFTELEPVYWNDYQKNEIADDQIGY